MSSFKEKFFVVLCCGVYYCRKFLECIKTWFTSHYCGFIDLSGMLSGCGEAFVGGMLLEKVEPGKYFFGVAKIVELIKHAQNYVLPSHLVSE